MRNAILPWLLASGIACAAGCQNATDGGKSGGTATTSSDANVRVTPIKPVRKTLVRYCEQPGQVAAFEEAPLWSKVSGYVRKVHVDIGDPVRGPIYEDGTLQSPGQTLLEIEVPELQKELAQKQAAVEQAKSEIAQAAAAVKVAQAMRDSARALMDENVATIERVDAEVDRWKSELARITELVARQAVTEKLADETRNKFSAAQAARKETAAKIKSSQAHLAESEALVAKADADLDAAKAKLTFAEADRDRVGTLVTFREIRAPFDGIVAARNVDTGHLVNVGSSAKDALLVVVNTNVVRVFVDAPEVDAVHIQPAAEVTIRLPSLAAEGITGTVTRTTWVLNQATRTLRVEIDIPNESGRLRPGMYAHARIKVAERIDVLTLPKSALMSAAGQVSCWKIAADGQLARQVVQTGLEAGGDVEILAGLTGDEDLIGVNAAAFREGQSVDKVAAKK